MNCELITRPTYILEEPLLRRNLSLINKVAREADVEIILAFKAFALWKTFPIFREYINATTASSLFEARLAYEEFGSPAHTYSPAYTPAEIDELARYSSHITFNSLSQYHAFAPSLREKGWQGKFGLRINPEYSEVETLLYNPCAPGTRFGVTADVLEAHADYLSPPLGGQGGGLSGFHCHCHCESGSDVFERTLEHIETKFSKWFPQLQWINFGGGHLMTRADYDVPRLIRILREFKLRYPWLHVILEPGSAFAWQTGPLVAQVVDIVEDHDIRTAILNVSFTCHMPDCLEMPYMPQVRGAKAPLQLPPAGGEPRSLEGSNQSVSPSHDERANNLEPLTAKLDEPANNNTPSLQRRAGEGLYRLGGCSCLSGDFMGTWQFDHELQVGENIIFEDMIHYTTVKTTMFNGVGHPDIALLHADGTLETLRHYTYEDYRDRMD